MIKTKIKLPINLMIIISIISWISYAVAGLRSEPFPSFTVTELTARMEKGKTEIAKLRERAAVPRGTCWKSALEDLQSSCKGMEEVGHGRLALKFASCYNEMLGFPRIVCERHTPIPECMKNLDRNTHDTFRDFFLHTQDMCYFIEHQVWQEKTSEAVNEVTSAVVYVTRNLEDAKETQDNILQSQQESLKVQSNIIKDNNLLYDMVINVKDVFQDVQNSATEQRQIFIDIFDKLSRMQTLVSWIQGEMSLLDMMGFYFACIVFGFFGTASERTHKARFWIVILMICSLGLERLTYNHLNTNTTLAPEVVQEWIWFLRRFAAILGVVIIVSTAAYYRDPQTVQNDMLTELNLKMCMITAYIEEKRKGNELNSRAIEMSKKPKVLETVEENYELSDSDTFSNYSNDSETDILEPSPIQLQESQHPKDDSSYNDENQIPETDPRITNHLYKRISKQGASPLREKSMDRSSANHSYNLRTRKGSESRDTSFLQVESPTQFAKQMKQPKKKSVIPSSTIRASNYFSSDDE